MKIKRISYRCDHIGCSNESPIENSQNQAINTAKHEGWTFGWKQKCPEHSGKGGAEVLAARA